MLRELNVNASGFVSVAAPPKPFAQNSIFTSLAPPDRASSSATAGTVPVAPDAAAAELDCIHQRLISLMQGMSAYNAEAAGGGRPDYVTDPSSRQAAVKLHENQLLLSQCAVLNRLQQQSSVPQQLSSESSQSQMSIFAPPQLRMLPDRGPSLRTSVGTSSGSRQASKSSSHTQFKPRAEHAGDHPAATRALPPPAPVRVPWPPAVDTTLVLVEFKRQRVKRCFADGAVEPGRYVMIPGDRGVDCGLVVQCGRYSAATQCLDLASVRTMDSAVVDPATLKGEMLPVLREATAEEVDLLFSTQSAKERLALKRCRELVQRIGLEMHVVDCEYQFDGTKISFYFESECAVDFRCLTKELFRIFNARIWLENVNPAVEVRAPAGTLSRTEKRMLRRSAINSVGAEGHSFPTNPPGTNSDLFF